MQPNKILIVDDSKLIHKMLEMILRDYPLVHAFDGREGFARLNEHPDIDLVLLHVDMPTMNGLEFLDEVKRNAELAELPIVIIAGHDKTEDTDRALALGADAYVTKPFRSETILSAIFDLGRNR